MVTDNGLTCSESFCNIHDVGLTIWDEDGRRPENRGRNPWEGFCLRIDALKRLNGTGEVRNSLPSDSRNSEDLAGAILHLTDILERLDRRLPRHANQAAPPAERRQDQPAKRGGGTPL